MQQLPTIDKYDPYYQDLFTQAKEMEKEQIIEAHGERKDYSCSQIDPEIITGEDYYNKTFNK